MAYFHCHLRIIHYTLYALYFSREKCVRILTVLSIDNDKNIKKYKRFYRSTRSVLRSLMLRTAVGSLLQFHYTARCAIPYKAMGAVIVPMQRASLSKRRRRFPRAGFLYIRAQSTTRKVARLGSDRRSLERGSFDLVLIDRPAYPTPRYVRGDGLKHPR